jgi:putative phosphonate metabolism protein
MTARYAIYFSPAKHSPWWDFGAQWLGRDECEDSPLAQPLLTQIGMTELNTITAEPRRYGFHATLKAPFQLSDGVSVDELARRVQALAAMLRPVCLGPLQAASLGDFVALVPLTMTEELAALAAACVVELDDLRSPLTAAELARRRIGQLNVREQELLRQYGYPYVLDCFRLHFTLSGRVPCATAQSVMQAVAQPIARLNSTAPLLLDRLCLFVEPAPGQAFKRLVDAQFLA